MSKYDKLWDYVARQGENSINLTFDKVSSVSGVPIDHSFLNFKKELEEYGCRVCKISMKNKSVEFVRTRD